MRWSSQWALRVNRGKGHPELARSASLGLGRLPRVAGIQGADVFLRFEQSVIARRSAHAAEDPERVRGVQMLMPDPCWA